MYLIDALYIVNYGDLLLIIGFSVFDFKFVLLFRHETLFYHILSSYTSNLYI